MVVLRIVFGGGKHAGSQNRSPLVSGVFEDFDGGLRAHGVQQRVRDFMGCRFCSS